MLAFLASTDLSRYLSRPYGTALRHNLPPDYAINMDDALSGNVAAGRRGLPSGSPYSYAIRADSQAVVGAVEARPHTRTTRQSSCTGFIPVPGDNPNLAVAKPTDSGLSLISFPDRESLTVRQDDSSGNI